MGQTRGKLGLMLLAAAFLAGCGRGDVPQLMNIRNTEAGPDEFAVVPNRPLQRPESFAELPPPTPGGTNRVDAAPQDEAIAALGGNPAAVARGIPAADSPLITHASRFGRASDIRQVLAAEDREYRRRNDGRLLERAFNVNVYYRAYRPQSLDQYAELERFRSMGVRTPSAPPPPRD